MNVKRVVIDTNVLISAALSSQGLPAKVVAHCVEHCRLYFSDETYHEFSTRLWRPKFDAYISRELRQAILLDFSNIADWVEITGSIKASRDPHDDKFLEVAAIAEASLLISGDRDLTELKRFQGIPIVTPAEAYALIIEGL